MIERFEISEEEFLILLLHRKASNPKRLLDLLEQYEKGKKDGRTMKFFYDFKSYGPVIEYL